MRVEGTPAHRFAMDVLCKLLRVEAFSRETEGRGLPVKLEIMDMVASRLHTSTNQQCSVYVCACVAAAGRRATIIPSKFHDRSCTDPIQKLLFSGKIIYDF